MIRRAHITLEWLQEWRPSLEKMCKMVEDDIRDIWILPGEEELGNFKSMEYSYNIPLYQKMIFRFRQGGNSPCKIAAAVDPVNRQRMLSYYGMYGQDELVDFLAWLKNGLGLYDLFILHGGLETIDGVKKTDLYQLWSQNEIVFFFGLNDKMQKELVSRYNREVVDRYNQMMENPC